MLQNKLPAGLRDLVNLGVGFYTIMSLIALFCNWNTPQRISVVMVLLIGEVGVLILSQVFSALAFAVLKRLTRENGSLGSGR